MGVIHMTHTNLMYLWFAEQYDTNDLFWWLGCFYFVADSFFFLKLLD